MPTIGADKMERREPSSGSKPERVRDKGLRIVSLCCLYPNPIQPSQGLFVQRRLQHLAQLAEVMVVAPVAIVQYGNPRGQRLRFGERGYPDDRRDGSVRVLHPRWFYPPFSGSLTPLWLACQLASRLARLRKRFPFDILDTHFGFPEGIAGALVSCWLRVPFTMTLRGNEPKHSRSRLGRFAMSWALRRADKVFAVSERLRQFAIELGASAASAKTIPNGIDADIFRPRNRVECRRRNGLPLDIPIVLSAGALVERKGHHRIIEALRSLRADGSTVQLAVAGGPGPEGQYERKLRDLVTQLGLESAVRFLGPLSPEALAEVMCAADIFCLASTNEGWPNVVHEALGCGTPVVATDVGAVPEMLAANSPHPFGIIVPLSQPAMLREAIALALRRDWDRAAIADWGGSRGWPKVAAEVLEEMAAIRTGQRTAKLGK